MSDNIKSYLSPILTHDLIKDWRFDPDDETKIIGTWAEDGSEYYITCPTQIRHCICAMQNLISKMFEEFYDNQRNDSSLLQKNQFTYRISTNLY